MTLMLDRRLLLKAGTLGLGALALPGAAPLLAARGFTHNVASGEPGPRSVLLWTRHVPASGAGTRLEAEVSRTSDFVQVIAGAGVETGPERDFTAKALVEGLAPGEWYFYRFRAPDGTTSPVGRTRTLPGGPTQRFTLGIFSCSNLPYGWFNAYAHAAGRSDIDLMVHLGDYLYEYQRGKYPTAAEALPERVIDPADEILQLADYRLRHAAYRVDPDLQRLHQLFPMVAMWDDHESANDSWQGGAENHDSAREGAWDVRKAAAMRAYREWLPVSEANWTSYQIGDLATLFRPETRLIGRSRPFELEQVLAGQRDIAGALRAFRDGAWRDHSRTMLGQEQENWLAEGLRSSVRSGTRWQVLGQQVIMGAMNLPKEAADWNPAGAGEQVRARTAVGLAAAQLGLPFNFDQWDGYPVARERLLRASLEAQANLIVLAGDSHNAWNFDLDVGGTPAGVEFAATSVTSPGNESYGLAVTPDAMARATIGASPQLKWADLSRRGYLTLELTPERATGEHVFLKTVRQRSTALSGRHAMSVELDRRKLSTA